MPRKTTKSARSAPPDPRIDALQHDQGEKRVLIPSREEAGTEEASSVVKAARSAEYPLNPVTKRGQDPELYWMHKYGADDAETRLAVDIRSLYRHEYVKPEAIIQRLYRMQKSEERQRDLFVSDTFGNPVDVDELDKPKQYYKHAQDWRNRLIQGDSLLVMTSLLEREGLAGKVQMIYIDPPYGIKYGSNWQMRLNDRNVKDGDDANLSGEPEVIKAFRDTWELGIHSYLSYLRDRLLVARELLTESGSCFVQISDENVHLVRCLMDELFGSDGFVSLISVSKAGGGLQAADRIATKLDYLIWYAAKRDAMKFRRYFVAKNEPVDAGFTRVQLKDGTRRSMTKEERETVRLPEGARAYATVLMTKPGPGSKFEVLYKGKTYTSGSRWWGTTPEGMRKLIAADRVEATPSTLRFVNFYDDFRYGGLSNLWHGLGGAADPAYVVQTNPEILKRCILMTTDPGDLILDPTCGSGTTAFVAEQWGRRWITSDTSRIALSIAKTRLMTATFPWYKLYDPQGEDVRQGFHYKKVPHVTLKSLANEEPPEEETLYDKPEEDRQRMRVTGPFTVETLQSFEPVSPEAVETGEAEAEGLQRFTERVFAHLQSAGIKNGIRNENAVFTRVDTLPHDALHAEGWYEVERNGRKGEAKAYLHIGPQFGVVSRQAVNDAIRECRLRGDADWLVILGFGFESDIENRQETTKLGGFMVTKVRMHDDLMQAGLIKKDRKAASFVTIGEPDIVAEDQGDGSVVVEIRGLDIYDPIRDELRARSVADINYWMVDDDYDGASFIVRQVFFCGGDKDEFDKWKSGLSDLVRQTTKRKVEQTLKIEIDDEAFDRLYGFRSHPIPKRKGRRLAVRVVSQFGEESTKVIRL